MKRFLFLLVMLATGIISAAPNVTGSAYTLRHYYSFDGSLRDYRWLNNSAHTAVHQGSGSLTYSTSHPSVIVANSNKSASVEFDGSEYLDVHYDFLGSLYYSKEVTISFWVKFDNSTPYGNDCFIGKNTSTGGNGFLFGVWSNQMEVQIDHHYRKQTYVDGSTGLDLYDGNWHHIVLAIDEDDSNPGTSDVSLWIDSVQKWNKLQVSDLMEYDDVYQGYTPTIGMERDGTAESGKSDYLEGKIDELKVFNSGTPNSADISNLYYARFGVEVEHNIWTNSIEIYPSYSNLLGSHDEADGVVYEARQLINQYYPVAYTSAVQKKSTQVDTANLTNHDQDYYEIVFNTGHGFISGFRPYDTVSGGWPGDAIQPSDYAYTSGNDNVGSRWVFYHACRVLKYAWFNGSDGEFGPLFSEEYCYDGTDSNPAKTTAPCYDDGSGHADGLEDWFEERFADTDGPNAIFGFASSAIMRSSGINTPDPNTSPPTECFGQYCYTQNSTYTDYDENIINFGHEFWQKVVRDNLPVWEAYKQVIQSKMVPHITGVRPVIVYRKDIFNGFDGSKERFNNIYRPRSNSNMMIVADSVEYGTPTY